MAPLLPLGTFRGLDSDDDDDYFPPLFSREDSRPKSPTNPHPYGNFASPVDDDVWIPETPEQGKALRLQDEIIHVATLYFGYTARVPLPDGRLLGTEQERKDFCRSFGLIWHQVAAVQEIFQYPAVAAIVDFFDRLAQGSDLSPDEWDLSDKNQQSVSQSPLFKHFRPVFSAKTQKNDSGKEMPLYTLYMLDLQPKDALWRLAVKNASDALMICRLDRRFTVHDIVDFLLTNGIPFHTLQPSQTVSRTPNLPRPCLSQLVRPDNYVFDKRDYLAYREHCHTILNHPRGRAALMHGHFMWRIAFRSVLWESVYSGPSGWSTDIDEMIVVRDPSTGTEFIDDKLSAAEQEALCGTYRCFMGMSSHSHQTLILLILC
jgi:hypothetical protein